jgi:transcriptional regulator GlxA family with amidase domain
MHRVVVVALNSVVPFDLATPCDVFSRVFLPNGTLGYRVRVCGPTPDLDAGLFKIRVDCGLSELTRADTIIVAGVSDVRAPVPEALIRALCKAASLGVRIASICSGAFILAATGLLDGKRATTHWLGARELAERYPRIRVDPDVLYVDEGQVLTSAGAAAAFDLCLHIIRKDFGAAVAAGCARISVMPLERDGGQSQFIAHPPPVDDGSSLQPILRWLEHNLREELSLEDMAKHAKMSVRSLSRRFREQTGTTPLQWLLRARVRRAQLLLETEDHSIEQLATSCGFGSVAAFREHFRRIVGTSPQSYRRSFRSKAPAPRAIDGPSHPRSAAALEVRKAQA